MSSLNKRKSKLSEQIEFTFIYREKSRLIKRLGLLQGSRETKDPLKATGSKYWMRLYGQHHYGLRFEKEN